MTRKQIFRFIIAMKMVSAGENALFRWLLPKRIKRWNVDPMNVITLRCCLEAYVFQPPMKWPWDATMDGGTYWQESIIYGATE